MDEIRSNRSQERCETATETIEKEKLIDKYIKYIRTLAYEYKMSNQFISYEIDDYVSEAILVLLTIQDKHNQKRGKFITLLKHAIINHFNYITKKERNEIEIVDYGSEKNIDDYAGSPYIFSLFDYQFSKLSKFTQDVLTMVINSPKSYKTKLKRHFGISEKQFEIMKKEIVENMVF